MKPPWLKRILIGLVFLVTLVVLFYAEEDWRGARELARVKKELVAKGESLDSKDLNPPPIPDELNVVAAPLFAEVLEKKTVEEAKTARLYAFNEFFSAHGGPGSLFFISSTNDFSLGDWQKRLAGKSDPATALGDVTAGLDPLNPLLGEVEAALARPGVRWPDHSLNDPFAVGLPYLNQAMTITRFLSLRGFVDVERRDGATALRDVSLIFRFSEIMGGRFLVDYLGAAGMDGYAYGVISYGLRQGVWSDAQIAEIERLLARKDTLADFQAMLRHERLQAMRFYALGLSSQDDTTDARVKALRLFNRIRPRGWHDLDEACFFDTYQKMIETADIQAGTVDPGATAVEEATLKRDLTGLSKFIRLFSAFSIGMFDTLPPRAAKLQAALNEAKAACALERERLRTGALSETLPGVTVDPIGGGPLHYVRKGGGYLLYSVGWNAKDDGGVLHKDVHLGDWPWPSQPDLLQSVNP